MEMIIRKVNHQQDRRDEDNLFRPAIKFPEKKNENKEIKKKHGDELRSGDKEDSPGNVCQESRDFNGDIRQESRKIKINPATKAEKGINKTPIKFNTTIKKPPKGTMSKFATRPERENKLK